MIHSGWDFVAIFDPEINARLGIHITSFINLGSPVWG
jgi:hypothetical protein